MPSFTTILSLSALAALAQAITVTYPTQTTVWDASKDQTITWSSVSTDPDAVDVYLVHMASQPSTRDLLFSNVKTSDGKVTVAKTQLPEGTAYQISLVKPNMPEQIYAQSNQFNITGTAEDATSTLPGYTGPTASPSSTESTSGTSPATQSGSSELTTTSTGTVATTLTTSTGTASATDSTSTSDSTATPVSGSDNTTAVTASATPSTSTGAAAVNNVASGSFAALLLGAFALMI